MNYVAFIGRILIGLPFAMSGLSKLAAYGATTANIGGASFARAMPCARGITIPALSVHWPKPVSSASWDRKSSASGALRERRNATAVNGSVPGARPIPRSIRPGWSASSKRYDSATLSDE